MPKKFIIALCAFLVIGVGLWIARYPALYYYYLWRLNHTSGGPLIMAMNEHVEEISPHIVPLLVHTYKDVSATSKSRGAAALGLIKVDKIIAEGIFINYLDNKDNEIVSTAIINLGMAGSNKKFEKIISFINNPNKDIRWAVADYLGKFNSPESITLLKQMRENDPDETVREWATYQLQRLGVLTMN